MRSRATECGSTAIPVDAEVRLGDVARESSAAETLVDASVVVARRARCTRCSDCLRPTIVQFAKRSHANARLPGFLACYQSTLSAAPADACERSLKFDDGATTSERRDRGPFRRST